MVFLYVAQKMEVKGKNDQEWLFSPMEHVIFMNIFLSFSAISLTVQCQAKSEYKLPCDWSQWMGK